MGSKEAKTRNRRGGLDALPNVIFKTYSLGVSTNRDAWAYNFSQNTLAENMSGMIDTYNEQVFKWKRRANRDANVDDFVIYDDQKISWEFGLKTETGKRPDRRIYRSKNPTIPLSPVYKIEPLL